MSGRLRVVLKVSDTVLLPAGHGVVEAISADGYSVTVPGGAEHFVPWTDLAASRLQTRESCQAIHRLLSPWWETLDETTREEALNRLGVVLELLTGYRSGHADTARDGEPHQSFGPLSGLSLAARMARMAEQLTRANSADRALTRRVEAGELQSATLSPSTVKSWVGRYQAEGLLGLVDGRKMRRSSGFELLDPDFRQVLLEIVETFDGDPSSVNHKEVIRRARVKMKQSGRVSYARPVRATGEYVAWLFKERGHTTRAQRSNAIRGTSGKTHFPALRPGQILAIDATRADVLVWDPLHERAISVEILTAIDVATRVVLACRVVPKSADSVDASLLLYDVMRPFHMRVAGTDVSDWRWTGLPGALDFQDTEVDYERASLAPSGTLQGVHTIPAVLPEAIRSDRGSIFVSTRFQEVCNDFGIELTPSRGRRPSDNAHMERIHLTFDAFYHQLPGYKGNNVASRGRKVEQQSLYTAAELETLLRRWIALDYHQTWHEGLVLPGAPNARLTPIEMFDSLLAATGRIDLPLAPNALYQFLPIRWGTVRHDGVEFSNLVYDARHLDGFRNARKGQYRSKDRAMPFFYDPHDVSRVWWADPDTDQVHEIPWRGQHMLQAPMTDAVLDEARKRIRARGGNRALNRDSTQRLILEELTELVTGPPSSESRALLSAASRRVELSERDHDEAQHAQAADALASHPEVPRIHPKPTALSEVSYLDDEWPDLEERP
jgi:putative transposase